MSSGGRKNGGKFASSAGRATQIEQQEQQIGGNRKYGNYLVLGKGKKSSGVATGHKINVLKPVNLPSLKKEHEGQDVVQRQGVVGGSSSGWSLRQQQGGEEDIPQYSSTTGAHTLPQATNWGRSNSKDPANQYTRQQGVLNPEEFPTLKNAVQKHKPIWEESDRRQQNNKYIQDKEVECDWEFEERRVSHLLHDDEDWMKIGPEQSKVWNGHPNQKDTLNTELYFTSMELTNKNVDQRQKQQLLRSTNPPWKQMHFDIDHMPPGFPNTPHKPPPPPPYPPLSSHQSTNSSKKTALGNMYMQQDNKLGGKNPWKGVEQGGYNSSDGQEVVQRSYYDDVKIQYRDISSFSDIRINDEFESKEIKGGDSSFYDNTEDVGWRQHQFYEEQKGWPDIRNNNDNNNNNGSSQVQNAHGVQFSQQSHLQDSEQLQEIDAELIARYGIEEEEEEEEQWRRWNSSDPVLGLENSVNDTRNRQEIRDSNYYQIHTAKPKVVFQPSIQHPSPPFKSKAVGIKMDKQLEAQGIQLPEDLHPDQCSSDAVVTPTTTHTQQSLGVMVSTGQYVESNMRRLPNDLSVDTPPPTFVYKPKQPSLQQPPHLHVAPQLYHISHAQQQQQYAFAAPPHQQHIGLGVSVGVGVTPNPNTNPNPQLEQRSHLQPIDCVISGLQVGRTQSIDTCGYVGGWQQYVTTNNPNWNGMEQFQVPLLVTPLPTRDADQQLEYKSSNQQKVVSRSVQTNTPDDCAWYQSTENDNGSEDANGDGVDVVEVSRARRYRGNRFFNSVNRGRSRGGYSVNGRGGRTHWAGNDWRRGGGDVRSRRGHVGFRMRGGGVRDSSRGRTSSQSTARSQ